MNLNLPLHEGQQWYKQAEIYLFRIFGSSLLLFLDLVRQETMRVSVKLEFWSKRLLKRLQSVIQQKYLSISAIKNNLCSSFLFRDVRDKVDLKTFYNEAF